MEEPGCPLWTLLIFFVQNIIYTGFPDFGVMIGEVVF